MTRVIAKGWPRAFTAAMIANFVWINASEVLRYFALLRPLVQRTFPQIPDVAPMNVPVFLIWGVWDSILILAVTGFGWLYLERFGGGARNALTAGTMAWLAIFVLLWLGFYNMNLATFEILRAMLPWAWAETCVAVLIVDWCRRRYPEAD